MSGDFVKCPFCAGHELVSAETLREIELMLAARRFGDDAVSTEIMNIRNAILNAEERAAPVEPDAWQAPLCPTPGKRRYYLEDHTRRDAMKFRMHPYFCECGYWHLSKQKADEHASKINSPASDADEFEAIDPLLL